MADSRKDYKKTPSDQHRYWKAEFEAAKRRLKNFWKTGDTIVKKYLAEDTERGFQLNMFHNNIVTMSALLYGKVPKIDVSRRYADPTDDIARVASVTLQRLLNLDVENNGETYDALFSSVLQDRLLPGLGVAKVRYEFNASPEGEILSESSPIDYVHWRDTLWGWGRSFADLPWIAFRSYLTKEEVEKRFSPKVAKNITFKKQNVETEDTDGDKDEASHLEKAEIWEIWDKVKRQVVWYCESYDKTLETKKDYLKLDQFFPCPSFLAANVTTSLYKPKSDYKFSEDLYNEVDILQTRIATITKAIKVVGVYDKGSDGISTMFTEGTDNRLIPVDSWAMFAEKGGLKGSIDWFPIGDVADVLEKLITLRNDTVSMLQQSTGSSDIMSGSLRNQYEGNAQSQLKASYGSIRMQSLQDDYAAFISGLMAIKAEIICKHYDPKTIAIQSNMQMTPDAPMLPQAIGLLKNPEAAKFKVVIRSESIAQTDYMALQRERSEFINAISTYLQSASPLIQSEPASKPFLMKMLGWVLSAYKGSDEIEGVIDQAIAALEQQERQGGGKKPDPEAQKMQAQQQLEQMKIQAELQKLQLKAKTDMQLRQQDEQSDIRTAQAVHQFKMLEIEANMRAKISEEEAKLQATLLSEKAQESSNINQTMASANAEITKSTVDSELDLAKEEAKTTNKIKEIASAASSKILEQEHAANKTKEAAKAQPAEKNGENSPKASE